jgi:hypothetical protein
MPCLRRLASADEVKSAHRQTWSIQQLRYGERLHIVVEENTFVKIENFCPLQEPRTLRCARKTMSASLLLATVALFVSACGGGSNSDGVACTLEARASVIINAVDPGAAPIASAVVTYQINGGPLQTENCPAVGVCSVGSEQSGRFKLTVSKTGYMSQSTEIQVNADECHVLTERVTVVLRRAT